MRKKNPSLKRQYRCNVHIMQNDFDIMSYSFLSTSITDNRHASQRQRHDYTYILLLYYILDLRVTKLRNNNNKLVKRSLLLL